LKIVEPSEFLELGQCGLSISTLRGRFEGLIFPNGLKMIALALKISFFLDEF
jgi:hypothetical protein